MSIREGRVQINQNYQKVYLNREKSVLSATFFSVKMTENLRNHSILLSQAAFLQFYHHLLKWNLEQIIILRDNSGQYSQSIYLFCFSIFSCQHQDRRLGCGFCYNKPHPAKGLNHLDLVQTVCLERLLVYFSMEPINSWCRDSAEDWSSCFHD